MGNITRNTQYIDWLGEERPFFGNFIAATSEVPPSPTPTPSVTPQISPTPTNTETPTPTVTPTNTITPTTTTTPTPTPTLPQGTTEAYAYLNAVVTAGGSVDATMSAATITFYQQLYSNSLWDSLYAFYPFIGGTNAAHAVEGKLTYTITWNGGITSSVSGLIGNGTNGYGNTGFNPFSDIGDGNTSSMGVYVTILGAVGNRVYDAGADEYIGDPLEKAYNIASRRVAGATNQNLFDAGDYFPSGYGRVESTTTDGTGMTIGTARSDADRELYRNGSSVATQTNARTIEYTNRVVYFAAQNNNGVPNWYNSNTWGFFFMGKGLSDTEVSTLSTLINNYQTSLGRNTY